ncbi:8394_t:CDS:2, partial [Gigaspora rosea]
MNNTEIEKYFKDDIDSLAGLFESRFQQPGQPIPEGRFRRLYSYHVRAGYHDRVRDPIQGTNREFAHSCTASSDSIAVAIQDKFIPPFTQ